MTGLLLDGLARSSTGSRPMREREGRLAVRQVGASVPPARRSGTYRLAPLYRARSEFKQQINLADASCEWFSVKSGFQPWQYGWTSVVISVVRRSSDRRQEIDHLRATSGWREPLAGI